MIRQSNRTWLSWMNLGHHSSWSIFIRGILESSSGFGGCRRIRVRNDCKREDDIGSSVGLSASGIYSVGLARRRIKLQARERKKSHAVTTSAVEKELRLYRLSSQYIYICSKNQFYLTVQLILYPSRILQYQLCLVLVFCYVKVIHVDLIIILLESERGYEN